MKDTMILKNGTIIELEAGASLGSIQVAAANRAAMVTTWEALTHDNLTAVQIKNGDGLVVGNYTDLVLVSETSMVAADGTVLTTYSLPVQNLEEKRLDALEEGKAVQDGAIDDLGKVVGTLAEGGTV